MKTCTAIGLLLLAHEAFAAVIRVPQDVATIQQALDAIAEGDNTLQRCGNAKVPTHPIATYPARAPSPCVMLLAISSPSE